YTLLRTAASERDPAVLGALARPDGLLVRVDTTTPESRSLAEWVASAGGTLVASDDTRAIHLVEAPADDPPASPAVAVQLAQVAALRPGPASPLALTDGRPETRWHTGGPQQPGDGVVIAL